MPHTIHGDLVLEEFWISVIYISVHSLSNARLRMNDRPLGNRQVLRDRFMNGVDDDQQLSFALCSVQYTRRWRFSIPIGRAPAPCQRPGKLTCFMALAFVVSILHGNADRRGA
jgi:hypothetical protein